VEGRNRRANVAWRDDSLDQIVALVGWLPSGPECTCTPRAARVAHVATLTAAFDEQLVDRATLAACAQRAAAAQL
jgi:hypothetical protein